MIAMFFPQRRLKYQHGGMEAVFEGSRRQRGGNIFSSLKRMIVPIGRSVFKSAVPTLKSSGKSLAKVGLKVGLGAVKDKLQNKSTSLGESLKSRTANAIDNAVVNYLGGDATDKPFQSQDGAGFRKRRRSRLRSAPPAKRRRTCRRKPSRRRRQYKVKRIQRRRVKPINKSQRRYPPRRRSNRKRVTFRDIFR